jgi:type IV fimbrial biogenesis protein FimT
MMGSVFPAGFGEPEEKGMNIATVFGTEAKGSSLMENTFSGKYRSKGFTLVELMVVLCMIAILTAIAIPRFIDALPRYRLKAAARDLYSNMQKAKVKAIKEHKVWGISFDTTAGSYQICYEDGPAPVWASLNDINCPETFSLSGYKSGVKYGSGSAAFDATSTPSAITDPVSYTNDVVTFNPRGTCADGYVYLTNDENDAYAVGTEATGVVKIKKWAGSQWY